MGKFSANRYFFTIWNSGKKISGEITYYNKDTDNLLFDQPLPLSSGASSITKNIGRLKNSGLEFLLDTKNIVKEDFNWKTSFNVGINTSEVVTLPGGMML